LKNKTDYLLDRLQEECAEIIQIVAKAKAFGMDDVWINEGRNPEKLDVKARLFMEVNDFYGVRDLLQQHGIDLTPDPELIQAKIARVNKYMEYARSKGLVE
jgi:hypothetical protein